MNESLTLIAVGVILIGGVEFFLDWRTKRKRRKRVAALPALAPRVPQIKPFPVGQDKFESLTAGIYEYLKHPSDLPRDTEISRASETARGTDPTEAN